MKKNKKLKIGTIITGILVLAGIGYVLINTGVIKFDKDKVKEKVKDIIPIKKENQVKIIDLSSDTRPYAVSIDNISAARPQSGIQSAYIVYELIAEGGLTRLLALFRDVDVSKIGPVRSARHYFLDYVLENDAIFVHHGWSEQAESDISKLKINNLNGLANPSNMFYRSSDRSAPHNSYTTSAKVIKAATNKKYRLTSDNYQLLEYSVKAIDLNTYASCTDATEVVIPYSNSVKPKYVYDENSKKYLRFANSKEHYDDLTNEQLKVKNIIIVNGVDVKAISGDKKGRVNLNNVGTGTGYYISEGKAISITWSKDSRSAKTIYKDENGKGLIVNDGNTFIQIEPSSQKTSIK